MNGCGCPSCSGESQQTEWMNQLVESSAKSSKALIEMGYTLAELEKMMPPSPPLYDFTAQTGVKPVITILTGRPKPPPRMRFLDPIIALLPPGALDEIVDVPCGCVESSMGLEWAIIHLNDRHHPKALVGIGEEPDVWTRERTADWLDSLDIDLTITTTEETS